MTQSNRILFVPTLLMASLLAACSGPQKVGEALIKSVGEGTSDAIERSVSDRKTGPGGPDSSGNGGGSGGGKGGDGGSSGGKPDGGDPNAGRLAREKESLMNEGRRVVGVEAAHTQGFRGKGVAIGVIDAGAIADIPEIDRNKVQDITAQIHGNQPALPTRHGTAVTAVINGRRTSEFGGSIAPDSVVVYRGNTQAGVNEQGLPYAQIKLDDMRRTYDAMSARGVSIVNHSFQAAHDPMGASTGAELAPALRDAVNKQDMLLVWAAANDKQPGLASYPLIHDSQHPSNEQLERGWLSVVGYQPGQVNAQGSLCGDAARFCMAAPGDMWMRGVPGSDQPESGPARGNSYAAPMVAAAAGLVKEAYPWMDNNALRQTLLSTATRQDDKGRPLSASDLRTRSVTDTLNRTTGAGVLNIAKAVNGPSAFDSAFLAGDQAFVANLPGKEHQSVFSNAIVGDAGLIKRGQGQLHLAGVGSYTGATRVESGNLLVSNSLQSRVYVSQGATLGLAVSPDGMRSGPALMGGVELAPKGRLVANAALSTSRSLQADGADLVFKYGSQVSVGGDASIDRSRVFVHSVPDTFATRDGKTFTAIRAANLQGTPESVQTLKPGLMTDASFTQENNRLRITVGRKDVTAVTAAYLGTDDTRSNVAQNLESAFQAADQHVAARDDNTDPSESSIEQVLLDAGTSAAPSAHAGKPFQTAHLTGVSDDFIKAASAVQRIDDADQLARTLDSLSGQIYASSQALTFQQSGTINRVLGNRVDRVAREVEDTGLWFEGYGARGKLSQRGFAKGDTSMWGGQMGVDTRVGERSVAGLSMNWGDGRANFDRLAGRSRSNSLGMSLYGRYGDATGVYGMGRVGLNRVGTRVTRDIQLEGSHRVKDRRNDTMVSAYAETGYVAMLGESSRLTPFAGLAYDQLRRGAINEEGHAMALQAKAKTYGKTSAVAGLRVATDLEWAGGVSTMSGYGLFQQLLSSKSLDVDASYAGAPGAGFKARGMGLSKQSGWAGIGVSTQANRSLAWNVGADMQLGRGGLQNTVFSGGMRVAF